MIGAENTHFATQLWRVFLRRLGVLRALAMTIFVSFARQDRETADALEKFLERRGHFVELDDGETAQRPLTRNDVFIILHSKDFVFYPWRMRLEQRALDAWAEGRLIIVKLDHHFAPVGLRDLPAVDASFEAQRELVAWTKVADQIREKLRPKPPARASVEDDVGGSAGAILEEQSDVFLDEDRAPPGAPQPAPFERSAERSARAPAPQAKKGGGGAVIILALLLAVIAGGVAAYLFVGAPNNAPQAVPDGGAPSPGDGDNMLAIAIAAGLAVLGVLAAVVLLFVRAAAGRSDGGVRRQSAKRRRGPQSSARRQRRGSSAEPEAPAAAREEAAAPDEPMQEAPIAAAKPDVVVEGVFVSYARANATIVLPVCEEVKKAGRKLWIDKDGIDAGDGWAGEIVRAIKGAHDVLVMCSTAAFESDHVKREIYLADRYKKRLLPVFIEDAQPPEDFEYFFAGVQWLKLHETPEAERSAAVLRALGVGELGAEELGSA